MNSRLTRSAQATGAPVGMTSLGAAGGQWHSLNRMGDKEKESRALMGVLTPSPNDLASKARYFGLRFELRSTLNVLCVLNTRPSESESLTRLVRKRIGVFRQELLLAREFLRRRSSPDVGMGITHALEEDGEATGENIDGTTAGVVHLAWRILSHEEKLANAGPDDAGSIDVEGQMATWLKDAAAGLFVKRALPSENREFSSGSGEFRAAAKGVNGEAENISPVEVVIHRQLLHDVVLRRGDEATPMRAVVQDMITLGAHLMVPLEMLRSSNRWILIHEDVRYTLEDQLFHYRGVSEYHGMPEDAIRRLWRELWAVWLAAWRRRDRLWGGAPDDLQGGLEEGDDRAFGPITASGVGVQLGGHSHGVAPTSRRTWYVLRYPLATLLRGLQAPSSADLLGESPEGKTATPLFDVSYDDLSAAMVAPYLSPECYVRLRSRCAKAGTHESGEAQGGVLVIHRFSDDAWNIAVIVIEAMLCGFNLYDANLCHLSPASLASVSAEATMPACGAPTPTHSIYADLVFCLVRYHSIALPAAQNFLYATLEAFGRVVRGFDASNPRDRNRASSAVGNPTNPPQPSPDPTRLAEDWLGYVQLRYGKDFITGLLHEVATTGLCWTRDARWQAFRRCALPTSPGLKKKDPSTGTGMETTPLPNSTDEEKRKVVEGTSWLTSSKIGIASSVVPEDVGIACRPGSPGRPLTSYHVLHRLRIPLLPLLPESNLHALRGWRPHTDKGGEEVREGDGWFISEVWSELQEWLHTAELETSSRDGAESTGIARQGVRFSLLMRLIEQGILHECSRKKPSSNDALRVASRQQLRQLPKESIQPAKAPPAGGGIGSEADRPPKETDAHGSPDDVLANHPFIRQFTERGQLSAYLSAIAPPGTPPSLLPTPTVFLSEGTIRELLRGRGSNPQRAPQPHSDPHPRRVGGSLRMFFGGPQGGIPAGRTDGEAGGIHPRLLRALQPPLEREVARQLWFIAELRRRMSFTTPLADRARAVRAFLLEQSRALNTVIVPIPPTIRGEVWGVLLGVPPAPQRERLYARGKVAAAAAATASSFAIDRQLSVDIPRCHQYHPLLASEDGHEKLRRVIKSCLALSPALGYWQGIDSLCAVLLSVSFTDEALVGVTLLHLIQRYLPYHHPHPDAVGREILDPVHPPPALSPWRSSFITSRFACNTAIRCSRPISSASATSPHSTSRWVGCSPFSRTPFRPDGSTPSGISSLCISSSPRTG
ncbi:unnamed protein product [Phytomonas sp. EM1]|nr:unnamed protein product [Phytomonas sp. EM1]|eukprot:CCW64179.1 unnamed protein product [Phytomonas sp. isolate EM1]